MAVQKERVQFLSTTDSNRSMLQPKSTDTPASQKDPFQNATNAPRGKHPRPTFHLILTCLAAGMTQGLCTFHLSIVNLPHEHIQQFMNASVADHYGKSLSVYELDILWGAAVSVPFVVAMFSTMSVQWLAETFGRKASLFYIKTTINILAGGLCAVAKPTGSVELFFIGRLLFGVCLGIAVSLASMYMTECSPTRHRGMSGAFLGISGTSLFSFSMVLTFPELLGNAESWPFIYVIFILLCLGAIVLAITVLPESPKFLYIHRKDRPAAVAAIRKLHGKQADCSDIFKTYEQEAEQVNSQSAITFGHLFTAPHLRRGVLIGSLAAIGRSICGINIIYGYSAKLIATSMGLPLDQVKYLCIAVQSPQLVACCVTLFIIDRVPRRKLFLTTLTAMMMLFTIFIVLSTILQGDQSSTRLFKNTTDQLQNQTFPNLATDSQLVTTDDTIHNSSSVFSSNHPSNWIQYASIAALMLASWIFPLGPTPIGFILVSEITPQAARSKAVSVAMLCFQTTATLQYFFFPLLNHLIGVFSVVVLVVAPEMLAIPLLLKFMPETMGRTVAEVIQPWIKMDTKIADVSENIHSTEGEDYKKCESDTLLK